MREKKCVCVFGKEIKEFVRECLCMIKRKKEIYIKSRVGKLKCVCMREGDRKEKSFRESES